MIHVHPNNRHNNGHNHHDDNDNHNYRHNLNKTMKKRRRIFVRQNLLIRATSSIIVQSELFSMLSGKPQAVALFRHSHYHRR